MQTDGYSLDAQKARMNRGKDAKTHLLSGIVKCPVCGAGMYGNKRGQLAERAVAEVY